MALRPELHAPGKAKGSRASCRASRPGASSVSAVSSMRGRSHWASIGYALNIHACRMKECREWRMGAEVDKVSVRFGGGGRAPELKAKRAPTSTAAPAPPSLLPSFASPPTASHPGSELSHSFVSLRGFGFLLSLRPPLAAFRSCARRARST